MKMNEIRRKRLAKLIADRFEGNQSALAIAIGKTSTQVNMWLSGARNMTRDSSEKIESALRLPRGWLDDEAQQTQRAEEPPAKYDVASRAKSGDLAIPQYDAGGAMGNGLILEEKQPGIIKSWVVDYEWLRLNVRHHTGVSNLCIVTGFGPSMQPKYNPGDPLLLDKGVTSVETEGIYFFRVGKHGFIKQLQRIPTEDGLLIRAKSLNKDYDPFDITSKMDFEVFGKVLTVWKSEQV